MADRTVPYCPVVALSDGTYCCNPEVGLLPPNGYIPCAYTDCGSGGNSNVTVRLQMPQTFGVSGSPVNNTGTFTVTYKTQPANTFLAAPSNTSGVPSFRTITQQDLLAAGVKPLAFSASCSDIPDLASCVGSGGGGTIHASNPISGDGSAGLPLGLMIDPDPTNTAQITSGGLFVPPATTPPPPPGGTVTTAMPITGDGQVSTPIDLAVSLTAGNTVQIRSDGLYVPAGGGGGTGTVYADNPITGDGASSNPLDLKLSQSVGNTLSVKSDGLYASGGSGGGSSSVHFYSVSGQATDVGYNNAAVGGTASVVIGAGSYSESYSKNSIAIGSGAHVAKAASGSIAFGYMAEAKNIGAMAIGTLATVTGGSGSIAFGEAAEVTKPYAYGIGAYAKATAEQAIAFGGSAEASGKYSISFGHESKASDVASIAIGRNAEGLGPANIALGSNSSTPAAVAGVIAIGASSGGIDSGAYSVAIGNWTAANGDYGVAIGGGARAESSTQSPDSAPVAIGRFAKAERLNTVVGGLAEALETTDVAIGMRAVATRPAAGAVFTIDDTTYTVAGETSEAGPVFSIGDGGNTTPFWTRRIQNMSPGEVADTSTDAVNGSQLKATNDYVKALEATVTALQGTVTTMQSTISSMQTDIADLQARVAVLENP